MGSHSIGDIATATGVTVQTVRYYERRGLLPRPPRSKGNYRQFDEEAILVVHFVQQAQTLGFTLAEIQELLALRTMKKASCMEIHDIASRKVVTIDGKIRLLQRIRRALAAQIAACSGSGDAQSCPIIEALGRPARGANPLHPPKKRPKPTSVVVHTRQATPSKR